MPVRALDHSRIGVGKFLHRRWRIPAPALANSCTGVGSLCFAGLRRHLRTPPSPLPLLPPPHSPSRRNRTVSCPGLWTRLQTYRGVFRQEAGNGRRLRGFRVHLQAGTGGCAVQHPIGRSPWDGSHKQWRICRDITEMSRLNSWAICACVNQTVSFSTRTSNVIRASSDWYCCISWFIAFKVFKMQIYNKKQGLPRGKNKFLFLNVSTGEYEGNVTVNL